VPYRGDAPALTDLLAGQIQVFFGNLPPSIEHIRAGRMRALAVTSAMRSEALPDIPAASEFLPGFEAINWLGICAPKKTPAEIIDKLNRDINAALADSSRVSPSWAARRLSARPPTSPSSSPRIPRSGAR
jgi:tripartite-type tricarboxylate transporter receptor subunit TctC